MKYTNYIHCLHSVWVFIQSPMFLSAPEGQFIKRLPKMVSFIKIVVIWLLDLSNIHIVFVFLPFIPPEVLLKSQMQY